MSKRNTNPVWVTIQNRWIPKWVPRITNMRRFSNILSTKSFSLSEDEIPEAVENCMERDSYRFQLSRDRTRGRVLEGTDLRYDFELIPGEDDAESTDTGAC